MSSIGSNVPVGPRPPVPDYPYDAFSETSDAESESPPRFPEPGGWPWVAVWTPETSWIVAQKANPWTRLGATEPGPVVGCSHDPCVRRYADPKVPPFSRPQICKYSPAGTVRSCLAVRSSDAPPEPPCLHPECPTHAPPTSAP